MAKNFFGAKIFRKNFFALQIIFDQELLFLSSRQAKLPLDQEFLFLSSGQAELRFMAFLAI